jgi:phage-related protein
MILVGVTATGPHTERGHSFLWEIARPPCGSETLSVVRDTSVTETLEAYPLSATFVDNAGNETPDVKAVKVGDVYVVGA